MRIYLAENYQEMSRKAANLISAQIILKPDCVLGLATGSTPIGAYQQLITWYQQGDLDFSEVSTINLDEYKGLSPENPQSYAFFMKEHLFNQVNIDQNHTHLPDGCEQENTVACESYNQIIRELGGIDLQVLGLGLNGHIGFNEPGYSFAQQTHCVDLTPSTIEANKRFFASEDLVPKQAYTVGIKTIMQARKILLLVSGSAKAQILLDAMTGPVTPEVPASILQMHPDVTLIADKEALALF